MALGVSTAGTLVTLIVGVLVGGLGIYFGSLLVGAGEDYGTAVVTALAGALGWTIVGILADAAPVLGEPLGLIGGLLVYLAIIGYQYDVGIVRSVAIALIAWFAATLTVNLLGPVLPGVAPVGVLEF